MAVNYRFDIEDLNAVSAFDLAAAASEDLTPLMDSIGSVLISAAVERIGVTNVSPEGVAWPKSLRAKEVGGPTLFDSGKLMRSITAEVEARQVRVGSNMIYAGVHQTGRTIRPKSAGALSFTLPNGAHVVAGEVTIPARPYLGVSREDADTVSDVVAVYYGDLLGGAP